MNDEKLITITQASKIAPGRPSTNAVWRWMRKGVKSRSGQRVRLEHIRQGGKLFTSEQALRRFGRALADADAAHFEDESAGQMVMTKPIITQSSTQREASIEAAKHNLSAAGI